MTSDRNVARLTRQRCARVVAWAFLKVTLGDALDHVAVDANGWDDQMVESPPGGVTGNASVKVLGSWALRPSRCAVVFRTCPVAASLFGAGANAVVVVVALAPL